MSRLSGAERHEQREVPRRRPCHSRFERVVRLRQYQLPHRRPRLAQVRQAPQASLKTSLVGGPNKGCRVPGGPRSCQQGAEYS